MGAWVVWGLVGHRMALGLALSEPEGCQRGMAKGHVEGVGGAAVERQQWLRLRG